jgi:glycosyltransferase involved in cell wall biosynthesis
MKVLIVAPLSIGVVHGGVRTQAIKTAGHLQKLGVNVEYYNPWKKTAPSDYDIIHIFMAGNETMTMAQKLKDRSCKLAVSPVFFTRRSASTIRQTLKAESIAGNMFKGIFSDYSIKSSVCEAADIVLPNTTSEAELVRDGFGIPEDKITVIPNGVDSRFADASPELFESKYHVRNFTLFVGDCSARRKNVLSLLEAHTPEDQPLVLIGTFDESEYSKSCLKIINSWENVIHLGQFDQQDPMLESAYAAADVFVLPSQFETPGIAALEAALAGCKIAITEVGGTRDYFGNDAEYIDPEHKTSIMQAVRKAHARPEGESLKKRILENFTWQSVAEQTLSAYKRLVE